YELLAREGAHVDRFEQHPAFLDGGIDTLVWAQPLGYDPRAVAPTSADLAALATWIRSGGRLLYFASVAVPPAERKALALPATAAPRRHTDGAFIAAELAAAGVRRLTMGSGLRWVAPQRGSAQRRPLRVLLDDGRAALIISYGLGRGQVTAVLDEGAFTNARIANGDIARLAVALARPAHPGAYVSFDEALHGFVTAQHWWQIVPRLLLIALALMALALLVALAGAGIRLGPPLQITGTAERSPAGLVDGLAALLQRGRAYGHTLAAVRTSTTHVIARALGLPEDSAPERVLVALEPGTARDAYAALLQTCGDRSCGERRFVHGIALAAGLRKEYAAHGRSRH
ncbi:MAG: DUF4350 domain-containing protein, partial [Candidatus Eremiobacteraeota bacterium]|nr:DUF4350 domain-containing protein [Candidatus Eremiobacteraeota bacterium]